MIELIHHPEGAKRLGELLSENLLGGKWKSFRAAVAFAKASGVKHLTGPLKSFSAQGTAQISVGIDQGGTSAEAVSTLLEAVQPRGKVCVFHNDAPTNSTFHPKLYLFANDKNAECFIGSGNLTEGGLFTNYEAFVHLQLQRGNKEDDKFLDHVGALLDEWANPAKGTALLVTPELINELKENGDLLTELEINVRGKPKTDIGTPSSAVTQAKKLFAAVRVKPAPHVALPKKKTPVKPSKKTTYAPAAPVAIPVLSGFVITLQNTDVGVGQVTSGTSRRSPELFIPKACVHANPAFWGWPDLFTADPKWQKPPDNEGFGKMDRIGVRMRLGAQTLIVNWWYNPDKRDYRLRNEALRSAGGVGDILRIEMADGKSGFDYYAEVVPQGTSLFDQYSALCIQSVRNSKKKWGYY